MRQVFSSPRMENVERVAQILGEAGIETRITHARSYRGGLRGDFSYRDDRRTDPIPAVWIVKSEDQPAAREILRAAGLLDSTRTETGYALPVFRTETPATIPVPGRRRAFRLKIGLLAVIALVVVLTFLSMRAPVPIAPKPIATHAPVALPAKLPSGDSATPDALAIAVLAGELPRGPGRTICLAVDGHDPSPALLAALPAPAGVVQPWSRCPAGPQQASLAIDRYREAAGGQGTIRLTRRRGPSLVSRHDYDVRPYAGGWRVIQPYP
jgi:hypothetical protein